LIESSKTTIAIGQKAAQSLYYAFDHAARIGLPLDTHATINFALTKCDPSEAVAAFARLRLNLYNKWMKRRGSTPTGAFAFANARDDKPILTIDEVQNVHVHWALYVQPRDKPLFESQLFAWLETVTGGIIDPERVIKITEPPKTALRRYLLKGVVEKWAGIYDATTDPQGLIVGGRRTGTTANLRRSERIAADRAAGLRRRIPARPAPLSPAFT
jgi:hypothetical protein